MINKQLLKLWVLEELKKVEYQINLVRIQEQYDTLVGKKEVLQSLVEDFNLTDVSTEVTYHDQI